MSGPNSPNLNPLDYQVWGQSLIKSYNKREKQFRSLKMHGKATDNVVKDHRKRHAGMCVSQW